MKKLVRPQKGRKIAGVAIGLANYLNIDPTIIRILFVLAALPGGVPGILLYIIFWVLMPEEQD